LNGLPITPELILFGAVASGAALAALGVVAFRNPVRSALCLVANFFLLAFLYFTLNAELLGITQIVVYTGAIMVLFLFVIMLLNLGGSPLLDEKKDLKISVGILFGLGLIGLIGSQILMPLSHVNTPVAPDGYGAPEPVGMALFSTYAWPFEVVSILLLIGIVGSLLLAKRKI
jgi:NADH-quinone oxidoreductase subunit J